MSLILHHRIALIHDELIKFRLRDRRAMNENEQFSIQFVIWHAVPVPLAVAG